MYKVKYIIIDNDNIVAMEIEDESTHSVKMVERDKFIDYTNRLMNASISKAGEVIGTNHEIPRISKDTLNYGAISSPVSKKKISTYTLMYEDIQVLQYNRTSDELKIMNSHYLPFKFRNVEKLTGAMFLEWLIDRVNNINRTYMNMVYIARKVGRDRDKIILDSSALSITDNYWIKTHDIETKWESLVELRDSNRAISQVALTGLLVDGADRGLTSLFTTKGYFPKAVIGEYIYKLLTDAEMEYPAYLIGEQLGVRIAKCEIEDEYLKIKLFTNNDKSLVHASELKNFFDSDLLYNAVLSNERFDIVEDLQKMYIFNYIIGNPDLHEDNYGCIYNPRTFEIVELAPCYDHNLAFMEGFSGTTREVVNSDEIIEIDQLARQFIKNPAHSDMVKSLSQISLNEVSKHLSKQQLKELMQRIDNVMLWSVE